MGDIVEKGKWNRAKNVAEFCCHFEQIGQVDALSRFARDVDTQRRGKHSIQKEHTVPKSYGKHLPVGDQQGCCLEPRVQLSSRK